MSKTAPFGSPELETFTSKLSDAATQGTWLAYLVKRQIEAGNVNDPRGELLHRVEKMLQASKESTKAFNALSVEEKRRHHSIDE